MELRTRSQNSALQFFKANTSTRSGTAKFKDAVDTILAAACLRPLSQAKALLKAEKRSELTVSRKLVTRGELEIAILKFAIKHGAPDLALFYIDGAEAPIPQARRLADANQLTGTGLSHLLQLMRDCTGLCHSLDVKIAKAAATQKLAGVPHDTRYRMTSQGWSIPLAVALAEPSNTQANEETDR
jgi:hypothetical protein